MGLITYSGLERRKTEFHALCSRLTSRQVHLAGRSFVVELDMPAINSSATILGLSSPYCQSERQQLASIEQSSNEDHGHYDNDLLSSTAVAVRGSHSFRKLYRQAIVRPGIFEFFLFNFDTTSQVLITTKIFGVFWIITLPLSLAVLAPSTL